MNPRRSSAQCRLAGGASAFFETRCAGGGAKPRTAFTLIELILVMAILTISVSITAPTLSRFFRGRALDSEARRLLALTRYGQSRAASEGVPMDLWVNAQMGTYGLEAEPSYETQDPKAAEYTVDEGIVVQAEKSAANTMTNQVNPMLPIPMASIPKVVHKHPELPAIGFMPDGSISETSPQAVRLTDREGDSLWVGQTRDRLSYEIRHTER